MIDIDIYSEGKKKVDLYIFISFNYSLMLSNVSNELITRQSVDFLP